MLLYHAIHKTYDDFDEVFSYRINGEGGTLIETEKELKPGQVIILKHISEYAIIVDRSGKKTVKGTFRMYLPRILWYEQEFQEPRFC